MRYLKPLMLAAMAIFAFAAVGTAVAQAEVAKEPSLLLLENGVKVLEGKFKGGVSELSTLTNKKITGVTDSGEVKNCKPLGGTNEKDTTLCEASLDFTGTKKEAVACRSESQSGSEKDPVETILAVTDIHLANEETAAKVLQPLLLFKVLGQKRRRSGRRTRNQLRRGEREGQGCASLLTLTWLNQYFD